MLKNGYKPYVILCFVIIFGCKVLIITIFCVKNEKNFVEHIQVEFELQN